MQEKSANIISEHNVQRQQNQNTKNRELESSQYRRNAIEFEKEQ